MIHPAKCLLVVGAGALAVVVGCGSDGAEPAIATLGTTAAVQQRTAETAIDEVTVDEPVIDGIELVDQAGFSYSTGETFDVRILVNAPVSVDQAAAEARECARDAERQAIVEVVWDIKNTTPGFTLNVDALTVIGYIEPTEMMFADVRESAAGTDLTIARCGGDFDDPGGSSELRKRLEVAADGRGTSSFYFVVDNYYSPNQPEGRAADMDALGFSVAATINNTTTLAYEKVSLAAAELVDSPAAATGADTAPEADADLDPEVFRIALVTPSARNDVASSQTMVDAIARISATRSVDVAITDNTFIVEDAAAAIRGYAENSFDLVIAHGSQYGYSVQDIAPDFPDVSFAWGPATTTFGLDNVYAYDVRSDQGGFVLGMIAAQLSGDGNLGVVGPVAVGDAKLYIDGFAAGARTQSPGIDVNVNYIESFADTALAAEAAKGLIAGGAEVLTGSGPMVAGATGPANDNDVLWFGTQSNQTSLGPDIVVASQVYRWEVALIDIIEHIEEGKPGGDAITLTLENQGLIIEYNENYDLDPTITDSAALIVAGIADGSIVTGVAV